MIKKKVILGLVISIMIISSAVFYLRLPTETEKIEGKENTQGVPPGVSEPNEVLSRASANVKYGEEECYKKIENNDLIQKLNQLKESREKVDDDENDEPIIKNKGIFSELVKDNRFGYTYWSFVQNNNNLQVRIDANTKEIVWVDNLVSRNRNITLDEAKAIANNILNELSEDVKDLEPTTAKKVIFSKSINEFGEVDVAEGFTLVYVREVNGIETSDRILVELDTAGNLKLYSKTWTLEIPPETKPKLPEDDAINIAKKYLNNDEYISSKLMIIRPNYYWEYGMRYGFSKGVLCWVVELKHPKYETLSCCVFVDAIEGEVVGGF